MKNDRFLELATTSMRFLLEHQHDPTNRAHKRPEPSIAALFAFRCRYLEDYGLECNAARTKYCLLDFFARFHLDGSNLTVFTVQHQVFTTSEAVRIALAREQTITCI